MHKGRREMRVFVCRQGGGEGSGSAGGGPRWSSPMGVASLDVIQLVGDYCPIMESFSKPLEHGGLDIFIQSVISRLKNTYATWLQLRVEVGAAGRASGIRFRAFLCGTLGWSELVHTGFLPRIIKLLITEGKLDLLSLCRDLSHFGRWCSSSRSRKRSVWVSSRVGSP